MQQINPVISNVPNYGKVYTVMKGKPQTKEWRLFFEKDNKKISPWHDIPLEADKGIYNMITEIPRGTNAKIEINPKEKYNPLKQDLNKNGTLRFLTYGNVLNHYGAIPQTWEDIFEEDMFTKVPGDNDPLDIIDISPIKAKQGEVTQVIPITSLALMDQGETDWKIIAINAKDPNAKKIKSAGDIEQQVHEIREWYRNYKIPEGKGINKYAFNGRAFSKKQTIDIIEQANNQYKKLIKQQKKLRKLEL